MYYTTNGDDPTANGVTLTAYTTPFSLNTTATVKAIAVAGTDTSLVTTANYVFPVEVATIEELREGNTDGTIYKLTGEAFLTLKSANRNTKYIEDETAGIVIDDSKSIITTNYAVADGISNLCGTLNLYNGLLQFLPVCDAGTATSTGNTLEPLVVTLDQLVNNQARYVRVEEITIDSTGVFEQGKTYKLNGGTNPVLRVQYSDLAVIGQTIPSGKVTIEGVVLQYNNDTQLVPISILSSTSVEHVQDAVEFIYDNATIYNLTEGKIAVFNMTGACIAESNSNIDMSAYPKGIYIVRSEKSVSKIVK